MRLLLAMTTAALVLAAAGVGFAVLLGRYQDLHSGEPLSAAGSEILAPARVQMSRPTIALDAFGQIRMAGEPLGFERFQRTWNDETFRRRNCDRWRLRIHPEAPASRVEQVTRLTACPR